MALESSKARADIFPFQRHPLPIGYQCGVNVHWLACESAALFSLRGMSMDYYIVRIYRRESLPLAGADLRETSMTGLVENSDGRTQPFHDAATLWRLLAQGISTSEPRAKNDMG